MHDPSLFDQAADLHRKGQLAAAEILYLRLLKARADHFDALRMLGFLRYQQGRFPEALSLIDKALAIKPVHAETLHSRALVLLGLRRPEEALASFEQALAIRPDYVTALNNRGNILQELRRPADALASYDRALAIQPAHVQTLYNRGIVLRELQHSAEALASFERVLAIKPDHVEALNNRGVVLRDLKRPAEALASYERALAMRPHYVEALNNRGGALRDLQRLTEALASHDEALALDPANADTLCNRGVVLRDLKRFAEGLASFEQALAIDPAHRYAFAGTAYAALAVCDWARTAIIAGELAARIAQRNSIIPPFTLLGYDADPALQLECARMCIEEATRVPAQLLPRVPLKLRHGGAAGFTSPRRGEAGLQSNPGEGVRAYRESVAPHPNPLQPKSDLSDFGHVEWRSRASPTSRGERERVEPVARLASIASEAALATTTGRHGGKLRIAYLSADFRRHPVASLIAQLIELHDRAGFEIVGVSFGPDDHSDMRARLARAFDSFHDVRSLGDREVAELLSRMSVDIAVDLGGHTQDSRLGILAHRPAPVQATYLGYAGTTGAGFIDYVIADETVLPLDQQPFYTERIVHLPDCFLVGDSTRKIATRTPTRREAGLPDEGFVFCSFNNNSKITQPVFDVWMRLLRAIEGSVLWLSQDNVDAKESLRQAAAARGIDPARLVFAPRLDLYEDHLARHRLADLFLDTLPYNAHATASDALWAGLPLLTCRGVSFAGRVATSLLHAAGLPELVTSDLGDYEAAGLRLATDASLLRGFRQRLEQNRATCPLFDTDRFRRHIERAYTTMWGLQQRGEPPASFSVEPVR